MTHRQEWRFLKSTYFP